MCREHVGKVGIARGADKSLAASDSGLGTSSNGKRVEQLILEVCTRWLQLKSAGERQWIRLGSSRGQPSACWFWLCPVCSINVAGYFMVGCAAHD